MLSITSWVSSALADKVLQFSLFLFCVSIEENLLFHRRTKFRKLHHSSLTFGFVTLTDFPSLQVPFVELCRDSWRLGKVSDTYKSDQHDLHIRQQRKLISGRPEMGSCYIELSEALVLPESPRTDGEIANRAVVYVTFVAVTSWTFRKMFLLLGGSAEFWSWSQSRLESQARFPAILQFK